MTLASTQSVQRTPRSQSRFSSAMEKNLSAYALAAGSAGVALLACTQSAEAKIISTKTNLFVPPAGSISFDINNDGQMDFALSNTGRGGCTSTATSISARKKHGHRRTAAAPPLGCGYFYGALKVNPLNPANEVWAMESQGTDCANDVRRGVTIGPARPFATGAQPMLIHKGTSEGSYFCPWGEYAHNAYLGVKFADVDGKLHYGWVRVSKRTDYSAIIEAYAYETVPNKPIPAGITGGGDDEAGLIDPTATLASRTSESASLGRLAQGAAGLAAWRREDEVIAG
jgi:hypothetical protein